MQSGQPIKLVHVTTVPETLHFLEGQIGYMKASGFQVHAIASPGDELDRLGREEQIATYGVEMPRRITIGRDLRAVAELYGIIRYIKPHILHAHTPKGGLLGMLAARLARVPVRIYHVHGLPLSTATGAKRLILTHTERTSCRCANQVLCVSHSVRNRVVDQRLCPEWKIKTLREGSINGVDAQNKFNPDRFDLNAREAIKNKLAIPLNAPVIGFVGRIVRDKGIVELMQAWDVLQEEFPMLHMLIAGIFEPQDPVPDSTLRSLLHDSRITCTGQSNDTPPLYSIMDLVVLPTYREGFPVVPMEAAAMAKPVVATRVPGCVDAVRDGLTGTLVPAKDPKALAGAIRKYLCDPELRQRHGWAGRQRMLSEFHQADIWEATYREYARLLQFSCNIPPEESGELDKRRWQT